MQTLICFLSRMSNNRCNIKVEGFLKINIIINELRYVVKKDIVRIQDNKGKEFIEFNVNQIYKIDETDGIKLFMDNDTIIALK